jgi:excisionase family DNA binding protein
MPRAKLAPSATPPESKIFLSTSETGRLLGLSPLAVCHLITGGNLPAAYVGRGYLIRRADIDRFIEKRMHIRAKVAA